VTSSPKTLERHQSLNCPPQLSSPTRSLSPSSGFKSLRRTVSEKAAHTSGIATLQQKEMKRMIAAAPCACSNEGLLKEDLSSLPPNFNTGEGYENYDIPRNLIRQEAMQFYDTPRNVREAIESSQYTGPMANYDIPTAGPLPVFRKPCGCIMKLVTNENGVDFTVENLASNGRIMSWTCVNESQLASPGRETSEIKIPRVRLTGQGKMPVVDMSMVNAKRCLSEPPSQDGDLNTVTSSIVTRLPPKHPPVYAQINKTRKNAIVSTQGGITSAQPHMEQQPKGNIHTNYTNLEFANSLQLYENSKDVLARVAIMPDNRDTNQINFGQDINLESTNVKREQNVELSLKSKEIQDNYVEMSPKLNLVFTKDYEVIQNTDKPLMTFSPLQYENSIHSLCDTIDNMAIMSDSKFNTIKQMPKQYSKAYQDSQQMSSSCHGSLISSDVCEISQDSDNSLPFTCQTSLASGYVTIPRSGCRVTCDTDSILRNNISQKTNRCNGSTGVSIRRSVSVPCKRDRDSTSSGSSDSGVSTGSPRQSITDPSEYIK